MSDTRDPDRDQVAPVHNENPSCHDLVIEDVLERKAHGLRKYGTILQPHNGRSFLLDAYEEVLDAAMYLRGKLEEERDAARGVADPVPEKWGGNPPWWASSPYAADPRDSGIGAELPADSDPVRTAPVPSEPDAPW